ncbi:hypothetical protein Rruber_05416 (plasmid) [Rhodococcus ruber]
MRRTTLGRQTGRHPAVIDLLHGSPAGAGPNGSDAPQPETATAVSRRPDTVHRGGGGPHRGKAIAAVLGVAGVVVTGAVAIGQLQGRDSASPAADPPVAAPVDENGVPVLSLPEPDPVEEPQDTAGECRADRGNQKTGAGAIAAFNFAYYNQRNGEAARAVATPTSTVQPGPELQRFIDAVPLGTNYCQKITALSDGVYLVDLSVMRPGQPVERGTQTVTTAHLDGRWYVDAFT